MSSIARKFEAIEVVNPIELWKAIHGGCWPGPPVDKVFSEAVTEVIAGLGAYNLAHSFQDQETAASMKRVAAESLKKSLPALQKTIGR